MMRNIFLPEKIGSRRLFTQRMLSIMVQDNYVRGVVVILKPGSSIVENLIEIPLAQGADESLVKSPADALIELIKKAGKIDTICITIPATMAVIKELDVPFIDLDKIRLIIESEIEPLLPFSLEEAIVDFSVTKSNKDLQSSQVLAVALRKQDLQNILDPYEQCGIKVHAVTIDLFATYGLYQRIPTYHDLPGSTALVDVGMQGTRINFLQNNQLKLTRYIAKGLDLILEHISKETALTPSQVLAHIQANGMLATETQPGLEKIIQKHIITFFNDIQFTLNSFSLKLNYYDGVSKILFMGQVASIPNFTQYSTDLLQIPCELFDPRKIFDIKYIKNNVPKETLQWEAFINPLGAALAPEGFDNFNLRRKELAFFDSDLALKQLYSCAFLLLITFITIGFIGYSQIAQLRGVAHALEQDQVARLKMLLPKKERSKTISLQALFRKVEDVVKEKNTLWAPFSQTRTNPLEVLLETTQTFDTSQFKLDTEEFTLSEKSAGNPIIELKGYFASAKGAGLHHKEWAEFEDRINESPLLMLAEPALAIPAAERGIEFTVKLQKKPHSDMQPQAGRP